MSDKEMIEQLRAELAQAQIDKELAQQSNAACMQEAIVLHAYLADTCAARDALARECNDAKLEANIWFDKMQERRAELAQARDELTAVDKALGEFYCPVLDENDQPCGSFYKDHGVNMAMQEIERLRAGLKLNARMLADQCDQAREAENERDAIKDELGFVRQAMQEQNDEIQELWLYPAEAEGLKRQLAQAEAQVAATRLATEELWRFWNGNSLRAIPGFEDDIREAWDNLLVATDTDAAAKLLKRIEKMEKLEKRLASMEAARDYWREECGCNAERMEPLSIAKEALRDERQLRQETETEVHILGKALDESAQTVRTEHQLRQEAERTCEAMSEMARSRGRRLDKAEHRAETFYQELAGAHEALDECQVQHNYGDGEQASIRMRIFWLNTREGRAEALARLVNEKTAILLIGMANIIEDHDYPKTAQEARELAAQIREVLDDRKT